MNQAEFEEAYACGHGYGKRRRSREDAQAKCRMYSEPEGFWQGYEAGLKAEQPMGAAAPTTPTPLEGAIPEGCTLEAFHDGEGWALQVVYPEGHERQGECVAMLAWPESWPKRVDEDFLEKAGFETT